MDHGDMDHGDMDHGDMDHGDMDMAPDGIPLAEGSSEDRDGLEMDALPVSLGPVLAHWPAGVVLEATLHGDLVVRAEARLLDNDETSPDEHPADIPEAALHAARRCDELRDVLALAGWSVGADLARTARDAALDGRPEQTRRLLGELRRRTERSRLLRWSLRGVGTVEADRAAELGLPPRLAGDCRDRLLGLLRRADESAGADPNTPLDDAPPLEAWAGSVHGCDLAVARIVLATLGTPTRLTHAHAQEAVTHG